MYVNVEIQILNRKQQNLPIYYDKVNINHLILILNVMILQLIFYKYLKILIV